MKKTFSSVLVVFALWLAGVMSDGAATTSAASPAVTSRSKQERPLWQVIFLGVITALAAAGAVFVVTWLVFKCHHPAGRELFDHASSPYWITLAGTYLGAVGATAPVRPKGVARWKDLTSLAGWLSLMAGSFVGIVFTPA